MRDNRGTTFTSKDGSEIVNNYVSKDEDTKALLNLIHTTLTPQNGGTVVGFKTALHITKTLVEGFRRDLQEGLIHPNDVKKAIEDLQIALEKKLKEYKVQNRSEPNLHAVAHTAANGNKELADLVLGAISDTNADYPIEMIVNDVPYPIVVTTEGYPLDRGMADSGFRNVPNHQKCSFEAAFVLLLRDDLALDTQGLEMINHIMKQAKQLIIIGMKITATDCKTLALNHHGNICVVRTSCMSPNYDFIKDIAAYVGGYAINSWDELKEKAWIKRVGFVDRFVADSEKSILHAEEAPLQERVLPRTELLTNIARECDNEWTAARLYKRIALLTGKHKTIILPSQTEATHHTTFNEISTILKSVKVAKRTGTIAGGVEGMQQLLSKHISEIDVDQQVIYSRTLDLARRAFDQLQSRINQNLITPNLTSSDASKAPVAATNTMIEEGVVDPIGCISETFRVSFTLASDIIGLCGVVSSYDSTIFIPSDDVKG